MQYIIFMQWLCVINHSQDAANIDEYDMSHFLDMTADEDAHQAPPLGAVVKQLIKEANKHKSFTALFNYKLLRQLELHEQYQLIPNIKNPVT